jgi:hypothetical protein
MKHFIILAISLIMALSMQGQNESPVRKGFTMGGSIGGGVVHFTKGLEASPTQGGISLPALKMGWFLNQRTAVYLNSAGLIYESQGLDRSFEGFVPTIQYWATQNWWISGGFGAALDTRALYESKAASLESKWGKGVLIGTGIEVLQREKWALDLQTNVYLASVQQSDGKLEGATWTLGLGITLY